jgi:hypothetical protein
MEIMIMRLSILSFVVLLSRLGHGQDQKPTSLAHRRVEFVLNLSAPYENVFPLFGADKERVWAEGWDPQFVNPQPAHDQAGAVFTVKGGHSSVWVNTIFDAEHGRVQYACFAGESMVTLITIHVQKIGPSKTKATVAYERTALKSEANDQVNRSADGDQTKGPEWEAALRSYLGRGK